MLLNYWGVRVLAYSVIVYPNHALVTPPPPPEKNETHFYSRFTPLHERLTMHTQVRLGAAGEPRV